MNVLTSSQVSRSSSEKVPSPPAQARDYPARATG